MNHIEFHQNTRLFQDSLTVFKLFLLPGIVFWLTMRVKNVMKLWVRNGMGVGTMFSIKYIGPERATLCKNIHISLKPIIILGNTCLIVWNVLLF